MPYYAVSVRSTILPDAKDAEWAKLSEGEQLPGVRGLESFCRDRMIDNHLPHWSLMVVDAATIKDAWSAITRKSLEPDLKKVLGLGMNENVRFDQLSGEVWIPVGTSGHLVEGLVYIERPSAAKTKKLVNAKIKLGGSEYTLQGFLSVKVRFDVVQGYVP